MTNLASKRIALATACLLAVLAPAPVPAEEALAAAPPEPAEVVVLEGVETDGAPVDMPLLLTLEQAQELALRNNPSLFAAAARVKQARARVDQARSLYFPQIDATYQATHTHLPNNTVDAARNQALTGSLGGVLGQSLQQSLAGGLTGDALPSIGLATASGLYSGLQARRAIDGEVEVYSASLQASYIIFDGFSRRYTRAMARFGREETEAARDEVYRLLLDAVAQSFYGVQLARENVAIAEADEAFNERLLKEAELRRERGMGSKSDVLNFEVLVRAAGAARINADGDQAIARIALAALMGLPDARLGEEIAIAPLSDEIAEVLAAPDADAKVAVAMESRPDMRQSAWQLARLRAQVGQRKSTYYPRISAFASQEAQTSDNGRMERDDFGQTVGINLSYTLFAGGRNRATVAEARYQLEEATFAQEELRLAIAQEVRQAAVNFRSAQETLVLQRAAAEYVNTNRDLVEKEYRAGQGTLARLNQAQRDLIEAEARLALARVAVYSARHALETATGETISRFGGYIPDGERRTGTVVAGEVD